MVSMSSCPAGIGAEIEMVISGKDCAADECRKS